jgi:ubiquinone/menaquinone biosynthesis C-methylase UbiE
LKLRYQALDAGCDTGVLLLQLLRVHTAEHLFGIDPVQEMLAVVRRWLSGSIII